MRAPKLHIVTARIPSDGLLSLANRPGIVIQCGSCGQRLPMLVRTHLEHPLVLAGLVAGGDLVLDHPKGWRWDERERVWKVTAYHRRQRQRTREVGRLDPRAAEEPARLVQNRFSRGPIEPDSLYWYSPAAAGHVIPTRIECPSCRNTINEIDPKCSAPR